MNDYSRLDFEKLWRGRDKVTEVECGIILSMLEENRRNRVLELGAGNGRIGSIISDYCGEYFALDRINDFLKKCGQVKRLAAFNRICGDMMSIPAIDASFDVVIMVRVFNFLSDPGTLLRELKRVMTDDGVAIISYFHSGSLASVIDYIDHDCEKASRQAGQKIKGIRQILRSNFDEYFYSKRYFRRLVRDAGFKIIEERVCGLEDYSILNTLPSKIFVGISGIAHPFGFIPHSFVKLGKDR
ncbi:MAG: methyltransferase domain-containing protein [Thermoplasmata archaeon]|uniref:Methyltransferase domain-containing protein n=1 Tax=Candidatus Sysuiplasma superficiale TaxID=2823368 RepID=A0A8J7YNW5_9ARCH|nr:methyltransferase domain-containing protein [Candidatus Sysuiplasma superficiale]MBX8643830.1 methyltransferase domain-containing protein [Candidatus Sysuiplasma superficiale]MCL4347271.1 methyltransferase domain-containing protein [Candidatus Thermoplasmatota archaeon]